MKVFPLKNTICLGLIITIICSFSTSLVLAQSVSEIVTQAFFDGIINKAADSGCPGKSFYTRDAFLGAVSAYTNFASGSSTDDNKKEIAAFFAHVSHETGNMCHIKEIDWTASNKVYCYTESAEAAKYPCTPGQKYYGRGPLQLTWNYNYGEAGQAINPTFNGLNDPEIVATDVDTSFKASMWYWMKYVHPVLNQGLGFGATINAINGDLECNGKDPNKVQDRIQFYKAYCSGFGVDPGPNLSC